MARGQAFRFAGWLKAGAVVLRGAALPAVCLAVFSPTMLGPRVCLGQVSGADEAPSLVPAGEVWAVASQADGGSMILRDEFTGGPFLDWQLVRPQPDHVSFARNPGCLTLTTQRGTIHGDEENDEVSHGIKAKNLFLIRNPLASGTDARVTLHVRRFEPKTYYQQVGLLFYDDDDNYLKWSLEYSWESPKTNFVLVRETNEQTQHDLVVDAPAARPVYLRITKRGDEYECAYSTNGKDFRVAGKLPWGDGSPTYVGLVAKNGGNPRAGEIDVCIDSFEIRQMAPSVSTAAAPSAPMVPSIPMVPSSPMVPSTPMTDDRMDRLADELDAVEEDPLDVSDAAAEPQESAVLEASEPREERSSQQRERLTRNEKWQPTHEQIDRIEVGVQLNNFCLHSNGHVLACCDDHKVRVYSQKGELVDTWKLQFAPQAIGLRKSDGVIFVGGEGRLARLTSEGIVQQQEEFPRSMTEKEIEEAVQSPLATRRQMFDDYLRGLKGQLAEVEKVIADEQDAGETPSIRLHR